MDKETRLNQGKIRSQKAQADKKIWAKVPPRPVKRSELGNAQLGYNPQKTKVVDD